MKLKCEIDLKLCFLTNERIDGRRWAGWSGHGSVRNICPTEITSWSRVLKHEELADLHQQRCTQGEVNGEGGKHKTQPPANFKKHFKKNAIKPKIGDPLVILSRKPWPSREILTKILATPLLWTFNPCASILSSIDSHEGGERGVRGI
jgi:hypothetical protein